ncbi:MAG: SCO1664 family protein [Actinomycetota bacterium]|nr:MAG: SCO1664 family protein [Actinomycetota bacterium]
MSQNKRPQSTGCLEHLSSGELEVLGRMPYSSNATFLVKVTKDSAECQGIYKPYRGERSLWDFKGGLFMREVAAYKLSEALEWELIPTTILRADGPLGEGSLQLFIEADFQEHYFSLYERSDLHPQFEKFALFDIIANNADRKSGHLLIDGNDHIWGIDQGLCFHYEPKLRTVIWEFAGEPIPENLLEALAAKQNDCINAIGEFISQRELQAFKNRVASVLKNKKFPVPEPDARCYPWPLI